MINETTEQYIRRVGSAYALLMYRKQAALYSKKLDEVRGESARIESELNDYFDKAAESEKSKNDERWLSIAFRAQENELREKLVAEVAKCDKATSMAVLTPSDTDYKELAIAAGFFVDDFSNAEAEIKFNEERNNAL